MTDPTQPTPAPRPKPATRQEHIDRALALSNLLTRAVNDENEDVSVILDGLLNTYLKAAHFYGRSAEAAECLVQTGGQLLLATAMARQALGLDPLDPPPIVH